MDWLKTTIRRIPLVGPLSRRLYKGFKARLSAHQPFRGSREYWEGRYQGGGSSGAGSYGKFAHFKAEFLNDFVVTHNIRSVIEFGCGDGNQLSLANYPQYLGLDVSETAIQQCRSIFKDDNSKSFKLVADYSGETAELAISLDVIYHLVEDSVFEDYMVLLFQASTKYVVIYSSNMHGIQSSRNDHIVHRMFTDWVAQNIEKYYLSQVIENRYPYRNDYKLGSYSDFFVYQRRHD